EFEAFTDLAREKAVAAVCAHQLARAQRFFGTSIPKTVFSRLSHPRGAEPSAGYLADHRRWHHELASSLGALPGWSSRAQHLSKVLFPGPQYVLAAYGLEERAMNRLLLPAL